MKHLLIALVLIGLLILMAPASAMSWQPIPIDTGSSFQSNSNGGLDYCYTASSIRFCK